MACTSSLNCLSCENPYQTPSSLNVSPLFTETLFLLKSASSHPLRESQKSAPPVLLPPLPDASSRRRSLCILKRKTSAWSIPKRKTSAWSIPSDQKVVLTIMTSCITRTLDLFAVFLPEIYTYTYTLHVLNLCWKQVRV